MSRSNPPPPSDVEWGGHALVVEMHAGTQPHLWVTLKSDATEPSLLRILDERSAEATSDLESALADARSVQHPSLHPAAELIAYAGMLGIESPYVEGMMLTAIIQRATVRRRPLPQTVALCIAADMLEASAAAEAGELSVAGGLRPDFVLVGADGRTRLLEPGASRIILARDPWREDARCASYASPEQLEHGEAGPLSDVFTVGVLLWEMLTNRRLFMGSSYPIVAKTVMQGDVRPVARVADVPVSAELAELVGRALMVEPDSRIESVGAFAEALRGMIESDDAHAEVVRYVSETQTPLLEQRRSRIYEALHPGEAPPEPQPPQEPALEAQEPQPARSEQEAQPVAEAKKQPAAAKPPRAPIRKRKVDRAKRTSERPARKSDRPARRSDRPKRSNRPPPPAETPLTVVRPADDPVIRARDVLEAEGTKRRWPVALIGIGAVAMAVGSGIALLRHGAAEQEPVVEEQPASEPAPSPPPRRAAKTEKEPDPAPVAELPSPEPAPKQPEPAAPTPKARKTSDAEKTPPPPAAPKPKAPPKETPPAGDFDPGGI